MFRQHWQTMLNECCLNGPVCTGNAWIIIPIYPNPFIECIADDDDQVISQMLKLQKLSKQNVSEGNFTNWDGRVKKKDVLIMKPKSLSEVVQIVKAARQLGKLRPPRGSVKLIFTKLINHKSLEKCHHIPMGPPLVCMGLWWNCSNDTRFINFVMKSPKDPPWWP